MKKNIRIFLAILAIVPALFLSGCGKNSSPGYLVNLEIWGLFDDSMDYMEIINQYQELNPYVGEIKFRKFTPETYKRDLLDALASGQGPDIFFIQHNWLPSFITKLEPAPDVLLKKSDIDREFVDTVSYDLTNQGKVYGVPLSVDSLALYYNKDLFNAAGITFPPKTWNEFEEASRKLTGFNDSRSVVQSGAAIGTAYNINRSVDILGLLMLQAGTKMTNDANTKSEISVGVVAPDGSVVNAGERALEYYTNFAKYGSSTYTWDRSMRYSIDAFSEGKTAMMINYSWQMPVLKSKNSKLNFGTAQIPQTLNGNVVNYPNYWAYGVAKNKQSTVVMNGQTVQVPNNVRVHEAWQFLKFMTMKNNGSVRLFNAISGNSKDFPINFDPAVVYLKKTEKPAARRDIVEMQKEDSLMGPFAKGNLIAKSWFQKDPESIEKIFAEMIDSVNSGGVTPYDALNRGANKITDIMER